MAGETYQKDMHRKKRVKALKKLIILSLFISILIPFLLSIAALCKVNQLNKKLYILSEQLEELTGMVSVGQEQMPQYESAPQAETVSGNTVQMVEETQEEASVPSAAHKVYLTFDDGPGIYTQDILDILDRYDVKATFFVLGKENETAKEALRSIAAAGHSLGMHSYSHKYSEIYDSVESFAEDLERIQNYIYDTTGVWSNIYRFPGGSSNKVSDIPMEEFAEFLESRDIIFYDWNVSSGDGGRILLEVEDLLDNCMKGLDKRETSVILMHDSADKRTTVEALPMIIENILALEDTVILPITEETEPVQHIEIQRNE